MAASDACLPGQSHGVNAAAEADAEVANATHQPRIQAEQRADDGLQPPRADMDGIVVDIIGWTKHSLSQHRNGR